MGRFNTGEEDGLFFDFGVDEDDFEMELDFDVAAPKKKLAAGKTPTARKETPRVASSSGSDDFDMLFSGLDGEDVFDFDEEDKAVASADAEEYDEVSIFDAFEKEDTPDYMAEIFSPVFDGDYGEPTVRTESAAEENCVPEDGTAFEESGDYSEEYDEPSFFDGLDDSDYGALHDEEDEFSFNWEAFSSVNDENLIMETEAVDAPVVKTADDGKICVEEESSEKSISGAMDFADEFLADEVTGTISSEVNESAFEEPESEKTARVSAEKSCVEPLKAVGAEEKQSEKQEKKPAPKKASKKVKKIAKNIIKEVLSWVAVTVVTVAVIFFINLYVLRPSIVSGHSMDPTLEDGQTIVISKLPYIFGDIERGDIVIIDRQVNRERTFAVEFTEMLRYNALTQSLFFKDEKDHDLFWVKRVIGVEGDTISFIDGKVYLNGEELKEDYIMTDEVNNYPNGKTFTVGKGELFVMGDNRNGSTDSRFLSTPIKADHVVGKMVSG